MTMREDLEKLEAERLSPYAAHSANSRGRARQIEPCEFRTEFQRDRDRIIHCKSFRRMKHKTQVFLMPDGDHYRTRMTHTLEVQQIARTISRILDLNEDLTEAIALGHDLGHTPFGHVGEAVLDKMLPGGFEHNLESLRIVERLENGVGLNLTEEVRDGIKNHKRDGHPATLEGKVVSYADRIAYLNHDIDDAIRAGVLYARELPLDCTRHFGNKHGTRINNMIIDIVKNSEGKEYVSMSEESEFYMNKLRDFMFERVYMDRTAKREEGKARHIIKATYEHFLAHPGLLPDEFMARVYEDGVEIAAADYIACMTDRYVVRKYEEIFVPKAWNI